MAIETGKIPKHIAVIMDGNGRWARQRNMPRIFGHQKGADRVREIVEVSGQIGLECLTLYAFSNENWDRPEEEVQALFGLLTAYLKSEVDRLHEKNVRLTSIGDKQRLPRDCQRLLEKGERQTRGNSGLRLVLALSYGGRPDIIKSCQSIAREVSIGNLSWKDIDARLFSSHLCTWDLPEPDLLIRTSGEKRISNFLLWELAYTELYFCDVNWPDFSKRDFLEAIEEYRRRNRRFGRITDKLPLEQSAEHTGDGLC